MFYRRLWLAFLVVAGPAAVPAAAELGIGDAAPSLDLKEFVKGKPIAIEKGHVYVVEFWATWCGPCRESIPHLTELQKKYKDAHIVGISDEEAATVKSFVESLGDKMDYRVAIDKPSASDKANNDKNTPEQSEGKTARAWLDASGQSGIPTAFIVNRDAKVAWIGHPMEMEKVLEQVVAGTFDLQAAAKKFKEEQAMLRKLRELRARLASAEREGGNKAVLKVLDEAILENAALETMLGLQRFAILSQANDTDAQAQEYGRRLMDKVFKDNPDALSNLAWLVVQPGAPQKPTPGLVKVALLAALRADELTERKDPNYADTLARAYFVSGNRKKALETQERAVKLAGGASPLDIKELKERLEEYRKANQ